MAGGCCSVGCGRAGWGVHTGSGSTGGPLRYRIEPGVGREGGGPQSFCTEPHEGRGGLLSPPSPSTSKLPVLCPGPLKMALSWAAGSWLVPPPSTWGPPVVQPWTPASQLLPPYSNSMPSLCLPLSTWPPLPPPRFIFSRRPRGHQP